MLLPKPGCAPQLWPLGAFYMMLQFLTLSGACLLPDTEQRSRCRAPLVTNPPPGRVICPACPTVGVSALWPLRLNLKRFPKDDLVPRSGFRRLLPSPGKYGNPNQ